jgi:hypothetical protein
VIVTDVRVCLTVCRSSMQRSSPTTHAQKLFPRNSSTATNNVPTTNKREKKREKDKTRRKTSAASLSISTSPTTWYMDSTSPSPQIGQGNSTPPLVELSQELTPKRPLRLVIFRLHLNNFLICMIWLKFCAMTLNS